jgi:hypothetical protein
LGDSPGQLNFIVADLVLAEVHHNLVLDGIVLAEVEADSMYVWNDSSAVLMFGPDFQFIGLDSVDRPTIEAEKAAINFVKNEIRLRGKAEVRTPIGGQTFSGVGLLLYYGTGEILHGLVKKPIWLWESPGPRVERAGVSNG